MYHVKINSILKFYDVAFFDLKLFVDCFELFTPKGYLQPRLLTFLDAFPFILIGFHFYISGLNTIK